MVSKMPSPRITPRSSARRIGVSAGTTPTPRRATTRWSDTPGSLTETYDWAVHPSTSTQVSGDAGRPQLADELRSRGLRLTAQRQLVLEAVFALGHATPDQIHAQVSKTAAGVNITTVYRTLELLEE